MSIDNKLPEDFVFLSDIDPSIIESVRYFSNENFLGRQVSGYNINRIICTKAAALKLKEVNDYLKTKDYELVVYDGYRPVTATEEFYHWGQDDHDNIAKSYYYPTMTKKDMFDLGYVAKKSSHSRGSTFDITLIRKSHKLKPIVYTTQKLTNGEIIPYLDDNSINMGASFDLFHLSSSHDSKLIDEDANHNREILRDAMGKYGFDEMQQEWWHYTLKNEPYPDDYFNFVL